MTQSRDETGAHDTGRTGEDAPAGSGDDVPGGAGGAASRDGGGTGRSRGSGALWAMLRETAVVVVIALGLSLVIKTFLVQAFFIPSESMENTLLVGDRVLVSKLNPGPFDLERGDVVVFSDPGGWLTTPERVAEGPLREGVRAALTFVGLLPADSGDHLIKRVIGLPGDTVVCCDPQGRVSVNGAAVREPYLFPGDNPSDEKFTARVPAGRLWVMGDHRGLSQDSRFHRDVDGGTVAVGDVVGRAFVIVWPFSNAGLLRRPTSTFEAVPGDS